MSTSANDPLAPSLTLPSFSFGGYALPPGGLVGVGYWPRGIAHLIDLALHYGIGYATGRLFVFLVRLAGHLTGQPIFPLFRKTVGGGLTGFALALLGAIAYEAICEGVHGSTLGKFLLSITVVQEDGAPCRIGSAVIRSFAYLLDSLFFGLVGYSEMQKTIQEQRHGDVWAHTVVCKRDDVAPENRRGVSRFLAALLLAVMADSALMLLGLAVKVIS